MAATTNPMTVEEFRSSGQEIPSPLFGGAKISVDAIFA